MRRGLRLERSALVPLGLTAAAFVIALAQRPGTASSDTKIDLHVDPGGFLGDVASVWTPTGGLGHVQGGQYGGYLFPMGPFFALGHALGLAPWLVHRLWLGLLLALAAWGTVRLMDALWGGPRGIAHAVAGAMVLLNPYVTVFADRTSVTLLGYAALPWLLLSVHRGMRDPRGWWWPAVFALVVASSGGGVNAAVTAWVLVGPVLLVLYEVVFAGGTRRDATLFAGRTVLLSLACSLWWMGPVLVQALFGIDFLRFIEQPAAIWATTSVTETLRLMGYWISYLGVGFGGGRPLPYFSNSEPLLFNGLIVTATLLVPALALAGFAWTRRWRHGPFFLVMAIAGLLVMVAGFPPGTPLRRSLELAYYELSPVQFLRTTYKAGPLVAVGLACLGGAAASEARRRLALDRSRAWAPALAALGGVALLALSAWPLVSGRAVGAELSWKKIPAAWTRAADDLDRELSRNGRAAVLPGQLFAFHRWGGTYDHILPALSDRPVAVRSIVPYSDLHAVDLQSTVDALVQQQRLYPGQLRPLLGLLGVGAVVVGADDDPRRSGALDAGSAAHVLGEGQGLGQPTRMYGARAVHPPRDGSLDSPTVLPQVRRYDLGPGRGLVRIESLENPTVVDGSAPTLAGLAAFGALPDARPIIYAADRSAGELRSAVRRGAEVVIGDSNHRRLFVGSRLTQNAGWTLAPAENVLRQGAILDPFEGRGAEAQTVARYRGAAYLRAPLAPGHAQFPEHRPLAALDGTRATAWLADPELERSQRYLEIGFLRRRDVDHIDLWTYGDQRGRVTEVVVAGRRFAVGPRRNRLALGLRDVPALRVQIDEVRRPKGVRGAAGGIAEVRVPGLRVTESLRPPVLAERALAGTNLRRAALTYLLSRVTGDRPLRRERRTGPWQAFDERDRGDAEWRLVREIRPPAARRFLAQAWVSVAPEARDSELDRMLGTGAGMESSGRFENRPRHRASRAFDRSTRTAWIGTWPPGGRAWIAWRSRRPVTLRSLGLRATGAPVGRPSRVRLRSESGETGPLQVGSGGVVRLTRPLRGRRWRLDILEVRSRPGATAADRNRRAVGIAEIAGAGARAATRSGAGLAGTGCGSVMLRAGARRLAFSVEAGRDALETGGPLRATGCGSGLSLPAARVRVAAETGLFRIDHLRLRSPAPASPAAIPSPGRVLHPGRAGRGRRDDVLLQTRRPAWLVLGEGYNRGWRAWCDGRSLGGPVVIDGYANGWRAPAGCRRARFAFAPNAAIGWGYGLSALAAAGLLGLLVIRRRRPGTSPSTEGEAPDGRFAIPEPRPPGWPPARAALAGLAAGVVLGFVFALRAGVVIAPLVALILWRGIGPRTLVLSAGGLLAVVVPAIYVLFPAEDRGGYNFAFAIETIAAHWVGVAALVLLGVALGHTLGAARAVSRESGSAGAARPPGRHPSR